MNKPDFVAIVKSVRTAMKRHSPEILNCRNDHYNGDGGSSHAEGAHSD